MPPTGFKRSRALWDRTRLPHASKKEQWSSLWAALSYELQPFRLHAGWTEDVQRRWISGRHGMVRVLHAVPVVGRRFLTWFMTRSRREYGMAVGAMVYYLFVRVMHAVLDAGPMVLILTALIAIFTIGLGDNDNNDPENGVLSAYSVFNRGLERMLGTVDADDLLAQHLGGAAGALVGGGAGGGMGLGGGAHRVRHLDEADDEEEEDLAEDSDNDDLPRNAGAENNNGGTGGNVARRSGKKARRRDLQQRRELRRQREAALAMGFGQNDEDDQIAMQRLIEDQIRAERAAER